MFKFVSVRDGYNIRCEQFFFIEGGCLHQRKIVEDKELPVTCYLQGSICVQAVSRLYQVSCQEKLERVQVL